MNASPQLPCPPQSLHHAVQRVYAILALLERNLHRHVIPIRGIQIEPRGLECAVFGMRGGSCFETNQEPQNHRDNNSTSQLETKEYNVGLFQQMHRPL